MRRPGASIPPAIGGATERIRAQLSRAALKLRLDATATSGQVLRRALDLCLGVSGLVATAPIVAAAAVGVKLTSPGPALVAQERAGQFGRPFTLRKLRTMYLDAPDRLSAVQEMRESRSDPTFKIRNDPRITPLGKFLRRYSVDELPQFWNLIDGTMTLFGPRPLVLRETAQLDELGRRRLEVKPGLTCLWQVSGRSELPFSEWMNLDVHYIDTASLVDEARILMQTLPAVLSGRGAY